MILKYVHIRHKLPKELMPLCFVLALVWLSEWKIGFITKDEKEVPSLNMIKK